MSENAVVDPSSYQEVIDQLRGYTSKVFEDCANMRTAANTCVSTMGDDPAAARSVAALEKSINNISSAIQNIHGIMAAMQQELEDAQRAADQADF